MTMHRCGLKRCQIQVNKLVSSELGNIKSHSPTEIGVGVVSDWRWKQSVMSRQFCQISGNIQKSFSPSRISQVMQIQPCPVTATLPQMWPIKTSKISFHCIYNYQHHTAVTQCLLMGLAHANWAKRAGGEQLTQTVLQHCFERQNRK